jgi:hypothetical protein
MEQVINQDTVYSFLKLLVELGGVHYVDKDQIIISSSTGNPVAVSVGKRVLPIALFKDGMPIGEYVVLNPLKESFGKAPEREWFFTFQSVLVGSLVKRLLSKTVELAISKDENVSYEKLDLVTAFFDKFDEKMLKEIDRIKVTQWANIFYDKATHTAQLQSDIFNAKLQAELGSKIRKQSWEVFRGMMELIFGTCEIEKNFTYVSSSVAIPKADAILHVQAKAIAKVNPFAKKMLDVDLHPQTFANHLENLEKYQKLVNWFATGTAMANVAPPPAKQETPWGTVPAESPNGVPLPGSVVSPENSAPVGALPAGTLATAAPVEVIAAPVGAPAAVASGNSAPIVGVTNVPGMVPAVTTAVPAGLVPPIGGFNYGEVTPTGVPLNATAASINNCAPLPYNGGGAPMVTW